MTETQAIIRCNLVYLLEGDKVLLAFGVGGVNKDNWAGYGGKVEPGESKEVAAARELKEESGITAKTSDLIYRACVTFINKTPLYGLNNPATTVICDMYICHKWSGLPESTAKMINPTWFSINNLSNVKMLPNCKLWLLDVLEEKIAPFKQTIWNKEQIGDPEKVSGREPLEI